MPNPILQALNGMSVKQNNILGILNVLSRNNPQAIYEHLLKTDANFAKFVNENKGKTAEQIAQEHGINLDEIKQYIR